MTLASALAGLAASAAGLIPNGDFSADPADPGPGYRANGAAFSVFTEDQTWNRCGRFTAGRPVFGKKGNRVTLAELFCGLSPRTGGNSPRAVRRSACSVSARRGRS